MWSMPILRKPSSDLGLEGVRISLPMQLSLNVDAASNLILAMRVSDKGSVDVRG